MSEILPLLQELTEKGFGPWLRQPLYGLAAVRGTVALETQADLFPIDADVLFLFGENTAFIPTVVSRQQRERFGTDASLLGTLVQPNLAKVNAGQLTIGNEPMLADLIEHYKGMRAEDDTVPLTIIEAHGHPNGGRHEIQTHGHVRMETEVILDGLRKRLQQTTNTESGHPVLLISCNGRNNDTEYPPATISAPGLHLLYYRGYVSLQGDQVPVLAN